MTASTKLFQLESKISGLQHQYTQLLKERQTEIAALISMADLAHLDDKTLIGGLLFLKEKTTSQDAANKSLVEIWRDAGEKFLRQYKPKSQHENLQFRAEKQGNNGPQSSKQTGPRSQASSQKNGSLHNSNNPYQPTDQSPQEASQSGEA